MASGVGGGTLSTRTEIAGGSLPSDLVLISPRISAFPLSHVIFSSPFRFSLSLSLCCTLSPSPGLPNPLLAFLSFLFLSPSRGPFLVLSLVSLQSPSSFCFGSTFFLLPFFLSFLSFYLFSFPTVFLLRFVSLLYIYLFARFESAFNFFPGPRRQRERERERERMRNDASAVGRGDGIRIE